MTPMGLSDHFAEIANTHTQEERIRQDVREITMKIAVIAVGPIDAA